MASLSSIFSSTEDFSAMEAEKRAKSSLKRLSQWTETFHKCFRLWKPKTGMDVNLESQVNVFKFSVCDKIDTQNLALAHSFFNN